MSYYDDLSTPGPFGAWGPEELLIVCTQAGRVIYMSGSLRMHLEEDLTGRNLNDFIADKLVASVVSAAQQEVPFSFEAKIKDYLFSCKSELTGDNIHIYLNPLSDGTEAFIGTSSAQFISREINVALSMMFSAYKGLADECLTEAGKISAAIIRQNMYRLLRLSRNMLDCALAGNGSLSIKLSDEDAVEVCGDVFARLEPVLSKAGVRLTLTVPDVPVLCRIDREKLERMIFNLVSNSMISLENRREIAISLADRGQAIAVTVTDTGRGIEPEILQQLFSKHSSLSPGEFSGNSGAGFGLALVNAFARRHDGNLVVTSIVDQGTSACVTLPKNETAAVMPLGSLMPDYAGGHDRVMVELSTALGKEFYA